MANIQIQVDEMQEEIIKTDWLNMWAEDMEGDITTFLSILDDHMRKLEIWRGMTAGVSFFTNDTPYTEITTLENKW